MTPTAGAGAPPTGELRATEVVPGAAKNARGEATRRLVEHIGFAHTEGDLTTLMAVTRGRIDADQTRLELEPESQARAAGMRWCARAPARSCGPTWPGRTRRWGSMRSAMRHSKSLVCARTDRAEQQTRHDRALEDIGVQAPPETRSTPTCGAVVHRRLPNLQGHQGTRGSLRPPR